MSATTELLAILSALYLYECLQIVPLTTVAFQALWPGRFQRLRPSALGLLKGRAMLLGMPLPPLGTLYVTDRWPLALGPAGVAPEREDSRKDSGKGEGAEAAAGTVSWEALGPVKVDGAVVHATGMPPLRMASEHGARSLAALLRELGTCKEKARGARIERALAERLDAAAVRVRYRHHRRSTVALLLCANLLFLAIFAGVPVLVFTELSTYWYVILGMGLASWLLTPWLLRRALKACFERAQWPSTSRQVGVLLSPISAIRAPDLVAQHLLADSDPLAVAAALLGREAFAERVREELAELVYGVTAPGEAEDETRSWYGERRRRAVLRLAKEQGLDPEALFQPPPREDEGCYTFCPRCRAQYMLTEGVCASCQSIRLLPLGEARSG
jgi:hypothetical protein